MKSPALGWPFALAFILSLLLLCGLIGWLQNVHIITGNGMFKSIDVENWVRGFGTARLDPSNYLYFPLYGALDKALDALGILRGVTWKQAAYLNAFWASLCVAFVYLFALRLTGRPVIAALTALFHLGCGFVLLLAVINEDIMPAYTLMLASMLLAGLWFDRPSYARVAIVGAVFTLGWLIEWRLMFPTLPPLILALALAPVPLRRRLAMIATLIVSILAVSGIVQLSWEGHNGALGLHDILWTGKGLFWKGKLDISGWAGFSTDKLWSMLSGVGNYFLIVGGFVDPYAARLAAPGLVIAAALQLAIFIAAVVALWPRRREPRVRALAIVFLGTLGAGQVMNFYSQPQDPQMQVNVMAWLTVAWALLLAAVPARPAILAICIVLSAAPLAWNVQRLAQYRGGDPASIAAITAIEQRFPLNRTVFLYWGFEPIVVWQFARWSHTWDLELEGVPDPGPAPSEQPRFKWLTVMAGALRHARWTPEQHAAELKGSIDRMIDLGYQVVVSDVWSWTPEELSGRLAGLVAAARGPALHAMLHETYDAKPAFTDPTIGTLYELRRRVPGGQ
jgi:hypothetical protein